MQNNLMSLRIFSVSLFSQNRNQKNSIGNWTLSLNTLKA